MKGELPALTGIRGLAAFLVLFGHLINTYLKHHLGEGITVFVWQGPAVDLFFVLSGMIMSHVYLSRGTPVNWRKFFLARFARIAPLYYAAHIFAFVTLIIRIKTFDRAWERALLCDLHNILTFSSCWFPIGHNFQLLGPAWSVSVEVFCYLALFPLLTKLRVNSYILRWVFIFILVNLHFFVVKNVWLGKVINPNFMDTVSTLNQFGTLWRGLIGFTTGWLLWHSWKEKDPVFNFLKRQSVLVIGLLISVQLAKYYRPTIFNTRISGSWPAIYINVPLLATLCHQGSINERICSFKPIKYLGDISFSLYLLHFPFFVVCKSFFKEIHYVPFSLIAIGGSVALAALSYHFLEMPARNKLNILFKPKKLNA